MRDWSPMKFMYVVTLIGSHIQYNRSFFVLSPCMLNDIVISGFILHTIGGPFGTACVLYVLAEPHNHTTSEGIDQVCTQVLGLRFWDIFDLLDNFVYIACI